MKLTPEQAAVLAKIKHLMPLKLGARDELYKTLSSFEERVVLNAMIADAFNQTYVDPPADVQAAAEKYANESIPTKIVLGEFYESVIREALNAAVIYGYRHRPAPDLSELREKFRVYFGEENFDDNIFNWFAPYLQPEQKGYSKKDVEAALSWGYHAKADEIKGENSSGYGQRFFDQLPEAPSADNTVKTLHPAISHIAHDGTMKPETIDLINQMADKAYNMPAPKKLSELAEDLEMCGQIAKLLDFETPTVKYITNRIVFEDDGEYFIIKEDDYVARTDGDGDHYGIPNCLQICQLLIKRGYTIPTAKKGEGDE